MFGSIASKDCMHVPKLSFFLGGEGDGGRGRLGTRNNENCLLLVQHS